MPLSLFVPNTDAGNDYVPDCWDLGSRLFIMERFPKPEVGCNAQQQHSDQFEAFVYHKTRSRGYIKSWHCQLLPPPPYVREPRYWEDDRRLEISSYAALGTSNICTSINGVGTYRLHIESQSWKEVGKWTLPFRGKVEYVPELKLWFGLSAEHQHLAAADLSSLELESQPQLLGFPWKKELDLPEEWNLGSGKFCIARFFHPGRILKGEELRDDEELSDQNCVTVLTGVEVAPRVQDANVNANSSGGISELEMGPHKSRCHTSNGTTIHAMF